KDGIGVIRVLRDANAASAFENLFDDRLREALLDAVLEAGVLKDRHGNRLDVDRQAAAFAGPLVAAHVERQRQHDGKQYRLEHSYADISLWKRGATRCQSLQENNRAHNSDSAVCCTLPGSA